MNITLTLDAEQTAALATRVTGWKTRNGFNEATTEDYLAALLMTEIGNYVAADFTAATQRIAELAAAKPYAERVALISNLTQQLSAE